MENGDFASTIATGNRNITSGNSILVLWPRQKQKDPQRVALSHWTYKVDEIRQKKQNETELNNRQMLKESVAKASINETNGSTVSTLKPFAGHIQVAIGDEADKISTLEDESIDFQSFVWFVDGCIPVWTGEFFVTNPQTRAGKIVAQLMWSVILVSCHALVILFQMYLVYISYLPPCRSSDFTRSMIGLILWYIAIINLTYIHYYWKDIWTSANVMVIPQFPLNWILIELIGVVMIMELMLEANFRVWFYSNIRIVTITNFQTGN